jgi:segregation and condensation protein A
VYETPYTIRLDAFEGPLDLLLALVEKEKVDIFAVPLAKITDEYLATLEEMKRLDLDVGGDFLVVAAQLAYIKSRLLLPEEPKAGEEEPSAEELKNQFLRRLELYRVFQDAARSLGTRDLLGRDVFSRGKAGAEAPPPPELSVELFSLLEAFEAVLKRARITVPHEVIVQRLSLAERLTQVLDRLRAARELAFDALFDDVADRAGIIVTFLAILELARLKLLGVSQADRGAPILLALREGV